MHLRDAKLTTQWSSIIPKRYKRNAIHGGLSRAKRLSSKFNNEKMLIHQKSHNPVYPSSVTNSVIRDYEHKKNRRQKQEDEYITPPAKESILVELQYCPQNELVDKRFLSKFNQFTNKKCQVTIKWISKKVKSFFSLKDKNLDPACHIYKRTCVCDETYIG